MCDLISDPAIYLPTALCTSNKESLKVFVCVCGVYVNSFFSNSNSGAGFVLASDCDSQFKFAAAASCRLTSYIC